VVGVAFALGQGLVTADHEAQARDALQALVGGGRQGVVADLACVDLPAPEGAHGIDQQAAAVLGDERRTSAMGLRMPDVVSQWTAKT